MECGYIFQLSPYSPDMFKPNPQSKIGQEHLNVYCKVYIFRSYKLLSDEI